MAIWTLLKGVLYLGICMLLTTLVQNVLSDLPVMCSGDSYAGLRSWIRTANVPVGAGLGGVCCCGLYLIAKREGKTGFPPLWLIATAYSLQTIAVSVCFSLAYYGGDWSVMSAGVLTKILGFTCGLYLCLAMQAVARTKSK